MHKHKAKGRLSRQSSAPANGKPRFGATQPITGHVTLQWAETRPSAAVTLPSLWHRENEQNRGENSEKRGKYDPEQEH
ncbi:hypothetical protein Q8A67_005593 [Cirrhinus molitorella]|uniref:Uncharacterized protein n=1 Tax=Cirrhinus molitorella TaxID=172907 RepID=A0AA88TSS7_9TELE|nr:hypothetical protein Q8A67_005593 [Cirrhinus molitorella]